MRTLPGVTEDDVQRVVGDLVRYYGVTIHGAIFNCDPHPGNLLVQSDGTLVVLDWGQVCTMLPDTSPLPLACLCC